MSISQATLNPMPTPLRGRIEPTPLPRDNGQGTELGKQAEAKSEAEVRETFESVLGELLFGQMLKGMRKTLGKPAYFHGGRAEEVFTQQLDQVLAEKLSEASADQFVAPMYDLFMMQRR